MRLTHRLSRGLAALGMMAAATVGFAQAPPKEPLPPGAIARLGGGGLRHGSPVAALALSRDGKLLASGGHDSKVKLWDAVAGKLLREFAGARGTLEFSPDGTLLAVETGLVFNLVETATGKTLRKLPGGRGRFSDDGKLLASANYLVNTRTHSINLIEVETGKTLRTWGSYPAIVEDFSFAPDGKLLAGGCQDGIIYLWDPETGKETGRLVGHRNEIKSVRFSADGAQVLSAAHDGTFRLWDVATGKEVRQFGRATGEPDNRFAKFAGMAPDGKSIYTLGLGAYRQYDFATGRELRRLPGNNTSYSPAGIALCPEAQTMATLSGSDGTIHLWDLATGQERGGARPLGGIAALALTTDGQTLAIASNNQSLTLWDVNTAKPLHTLRDSPRNTAPPVQEPGEGFRSVYTNPGTIIKALAFSNDGKQLASGGGFLDTSVSLWDVAAGKEVRALLGHAGAVRHLQYLPDGKTLLVTSGANLLHRWNLTDGKELDRYHPRADIVGIADDGALLATRAFDPMGRSYAVTVLESATRKPVTQFTTESGFARMALSPDGRWLAAIVNDQLRLWNTAAGQLAREIKLPAPMPAPMNVATGWGTSGAILVSFAPDSRTVAVARTDRTLRLFEVVTGQERRKLEGHKSALLEAAFSADGRFCATADLDNVVLVWDVGGLPKPAPLAPGAFETHWNSLGIADAGKAQAAVLALLQGGEQSTKQLQERLKPAVAPAPEQLAALLADLDDKQFTVRQRAAEQLEKFGGLARPTLRKALEGQPSLEVRQRLEAILEKVNGQTPSAETLRAVRVVEVLERLGTPEARQVLRALASGAPGAAITDEARYAEQRLERKGVKSP